MGVLHSRAELREKYETARVELVCTELDLAITFCEVAATTNDQDRVVRNIANAERAYASAAYYLDSKSDQNTEIREKLIRLESLLSDLGHSNFR